MKIIPHRSGTAKCKLCLPRFEAESKTEGSAAALMNRFSERLEEGIYAFVEEPDSNVRAYTADHSIEHLDGVTLVHIRLSARLLCSVGGIRLRTKTITCRWKGSRLTSVNVQS
ncbi:MAG: hypothetical protein IKV40_01290 [Clostridia bacterium]|nr:hypothetical protein [Clostridia bacterium]